MSTDLATTENENVAEHGAGALQETMVRTGIRIMPNRSTHIPEGVTAEDCSLFIKQAMEVTEGLEFAMADVMNYAEVRFGDKYTEAHALTGLSYGTLRNRCYTASNVKPEIRRAELSFSHHFAISNVTLTDRERIALLDTAVKEQLTVKELQEVVRTYTHDKTANTADSRVPSNVESESAVPRPMRSLRCRAADIADFAKHLPFEEIDTVILELSEFRRTYGVGSIAGVGLAPERDWGTNVYVIGKHSEHANA
jgi:hypothetical protein